MNGLLLKAKKNIPFILTIAAFAVLYGVRMFQNHPWYDELYTYYSFICRGPVYAAIHWPLPNNHIGYSVLSGFLNIFGSPTIALRGISYLCALLNICLLYEIAGRLLMAQQCQLRVLRYAAVMLYTVNLLVHTMAVQGRGYTLATTCYLMAILCLLKITENNSTGKPGKYGILFSFTLTLGIYAVPSSTFWVIPLCLIGGLTLLFQKRISALWRLILSAIMAAICALGLYLIVWLAIGSNLLSKDLSSGYFGIYQIDIIKAAPVKAFQTGLSYMLASPYIQSMDRGIVVRELFLYLWRLFNQFLPNLGIPVMLLLAVTAITAFLRGLRHGFSFFELYFVLSIPLLPLMFVIQSVQPYLRVSSFFGVVFALGIVYLISLLPVWNEEKTVPQKKADLSSMLVILAGFLVMLTPRYRAPMADRENEIKAVLDLYYAENDAVESIFYTDDYQKYVLKFYYDEEPAEASLGEAKLVLLSDTLTDLSIDETIWPMLYDSTSFDFTTLAENYEACYKNDTYVIYRRVK